MSDSIWLFGYGSLIWRPEIEHRQMVQARLHGYERRFWQGSHDHRGLPEAPGRVVTLVPGQHCDGVAFEIDAVVWRAEMARLDYREKNGYEREEISLELRDAGTVDGIVYFARADNFAYLGDAPHADMAHQIAHSNGPSGSNADYLLALADALRKLDVVDEHVFQLESIVRHLLDR